MHRFMSHPLKGNKDRIPYLLKGTKAANTYQQKANKEN